MSKSKAESATNLVALFGFLTALSGLAQTMWTTAPWWKKDRAKPDAVATRPIPRPMHIPKGGEPVIYGPPMADSAPAEESETPIGIYLLIGGCIALVIGIGARYVLRKKRECAEKIAEKEMLA